MPRLFRFWSSPRWQKVLHVDSDLAEVEGLAAGTGLLTGDIARTRSVAAEPCPECDGQGDVVVIDLVINQVSRRCQSCGHRWGSANGVESRITH